MYCPQGIGVVVREQHLVWYGHGTGSNLATEKVMVFKWRRVEGWLIIHQVLNRAPLSLDYSISIN